MHCLPLFLSTFWLFSPFSTSLPNSHPSYSTSQIDLDRLISLTPLIDPSSLPSNVSAADLAEAAKANNQSESSPNPVAQDYPTQITGTINASYFVIPISYAQARAAVPAKYSILTNQIKKVWKDYERHKYPLILSVQLDHDIRVGAAIPDFNLQDPQAHTLQLLAFRFPFIDVIADGHTPFTYLPTGLLSNTPLGVAAGKLYGIDTIISTFTPSQDPYAYVPDANSKGPKSVSAKPTSRGTVEGFSAVFADKGNLDEKGFDFWKLVLNQPFFGNPAPPTPVTCGVQYKFYDTVVTTGKYAPVRIKGHVSLEGGVVSELPHGFDVERAKGSRFDVAFLEKNYLDCKDLA